MLFYSMRRFFWYQIYVSSTFRSQNMNFQRSPASNLAAIAQKSCFWRFLVVKKQLGNVLCAVYVGLMETNRLVPWLRQSDHPIQKYHAPRAARRARDRHIYWIFKFSIASILESASTYQSTPVNLFSKHKLINFTQTGLSKSCAARTRDSPTNKPTIFRNND